MKTNKHPRKRFDPDAELVFCRRRKLGIPGHEVVQPGDPVTPEIREHLGTERRLRHRLKTWFDAGIVDMADWESPRDQRQRGGPTITHSGSGWYVVTVGDHPPQRVRGEDAARALVEELSGE